MAQAIQLVPVALEAWNTSQTRSEGRDSEEQEAIHSVSKDWVERNRSSFRLLYILSYFIMLSDAFWCFLMLSAVCLFNHQSFLSIYLLPSLAVRGLYWPQWFSAAWGFHNVSQFFATFRCCFQEGCWNLGRLCIHIDCLYIKQAPSNGQGTPDDSKAFCIVNKCK